MMFHRRLTVLALASIPLGCPNDSTPADDDTSGTTENDDETTEDPSSVSLTTEDPSTSTDPSTTLDPDSSTDPTEDPTTETTDDPTTETTDDPTTETTDDPTTESSSSTDAESSSSSSSSSSSTDGESSSSTTTDTAGDECAQFQVMGDLQQVSINGGVFRLTAADISGASNVAIDDYLQFEFYVNGDTGTFDLATAPEDNYSTCEKCILVYEDVAKGDAARFFYQSQGTLEIEAASDIEGSLFYGSISNVRLVEVTIDPDTFTSTPVDNGLCIDLVDGDVGTIEVPDAWTCNPAYYGSGIADDCDCGCGVVDPDCIDMTAGSCDFCNDEGACSEGEGACPSIIDPVDNSQCVEDMGESDELSASNLALPIPDDEYDGSLDSMGCVTLPLAAGGASDTVTGGQLEIGMAHTFIGDLVVKVVSPQNTVVTVLSRPGSLEPADDGGVAPSSGDSSNISAASPVTFVNGGATDAESMGSTLVSTDAIVCADDALCVYAPNPGAATAGDFSVFAGENAVGNWQVCVGDSAFLDSGTIDAVTLTIDQG